MDLRQLRYFVAVARHGSMAAAGRAIHISQPALGEKIRQLEDELGAVLFDRHSRGVRLSATGERLLVHADRILTALEEARADLATLSKERPVRLSLGLNPTASRLFAADLLDAFGSSSQVLLREGMSNEVQDDVATGRLDAGFCYNPLAGPYNVMEVCKEPLYLVGPPGIVTTGTDVPFAELERYPLVLDSGQNVVRSKLDAAARNRGIPLNVAFEVEAVLLKRRLLLRHDHCTVVPHALFAEEIGDGTFNARRIVAPQLRLELCLVVRRDLPAADARLIETRVLALAAPTAKRRGPPKTPREPQTKRERA
jgi:LysR family nitrogen assimilation transcriptional regulator